MEEKLIEPPFPLSGVVTGYAHSAEAALSDKAFCPWAVNVQPREDITGRFRGGSRVGFTRYYGEVPEEPSTDILSELGDGIVTEGGDQIVSEGAAGTEVSWNELNRALQIYGADAVSAVATEGTAPTGYTLGCVYRARLVLGGGDHIVYMSRSGNWTDWDYGGDVEDTARAFLFQASEAMEDGETVTALIPHRDQYMLVATAKGIWVLRGEPCDDGAFQWVSRDVGIVSPQAWCKVGDAIYFLSHDGLYRVMPDGSKLEPLSPDKLPYDLRDINGGDNPVVMGYSHEDGGIYIYVTGDFYQWFHDLSAGGFWPLTLILPSDNAIRSMFVQDGVLTLWDGADYWQMGGADDDGTAIQSYVALGPFRFGSGSSYGMLTSCQGVVDTYGTVTCEVLKASTAQQAVDDAKAAIEADLVGDDISAYVSHSRQWSGGRSNLSYPRVRGMWLVILLRSTAPWAFESLALRTSDVGGWR